jgi:hypothetical protein
MNIKKCRPVLIKSSNIEEVLWITTSGQLIYTHVSGEYKEKYKPQQLILISLEDEKIEVGDKCYDEETGSYITFQDCLPKYHYTGYKKVIATQSQLSTEYIQQFIEEYNKGKVKDVEIEMDKKHELVSKGLDGFPEDDIYWWKDKPKLTNGFITIVKKEDYELVSIGEEVIKLPIQELKEPILYTEEEVWNIINNCLKATGKEIRAKMKNIHTNAYIVFDGQDLEDWFKQNKKK